MKKIYVALLSVFVSFNVLSLTDETRLITSIGSQNGKTYFTISPPASTTCLWNVLYVDSSVLAGRLQYALLLSAYSVGKGLTRIDYTVNSSGECWVSLLNY